MAPAWIRCLLVAALACGAPPPPRTAPGEPAAAPPPATEPAPPAEPPRAEPAGRDPKAELLAAETSAWEAARPTFVKYCASCHTRSGKKSSKKKLAHFDMDSYPFGGHHAQTIGPEIRRVLGLTGKKPKMPSDKPGAVKGDELAAIAAWASAWDAAERGGAHAAPPP